MHRLALPLLTRRAPTTAQAQSVEARQRQQGEDALNKRLSVLRDYEEKLHKAQAAKLQEYQAACVSVWGEDADRRGQADQARWVR